MKSLYINFILLNFVLLILTRRRLGDPYIRGAHISNDDSFLAHALRFVNPDIFINDSFINLYQTWVNKSALNLIPSLLLKYFSLDPINLFLPVTIFQNLLLFNVVAFISFKYFPSVLTPWITSLFFFTFQPQLWNLAWFGDLTWMPYGMWLALPFVILSVYYAFEGVFKKSIYLLLITQLIHPTLGLMLAGYLFLQFISNWKKISKEFYAILLTYVVILLGQLFLGSSVKTQSMPSRYITEWVDSIGHFHFFNLFDSFDFGSSLKAWLYFVLICTFTSIFLFKISVNHLKSFLILAAYSILHGLIEVIGVATYTPAILRLVGSRFTVVPLVFGFIIITSYCVQLIFSTKRSYRLSALFLILYPIPSNILIVILKLIYTLNPTKLLFRMINYLSNLLLVISIYFTLELFFLYHYNEIYNRLFLFEHTPNLLFYDPRGYLIGNYLWNILLTDKLLYTILLLTALLIISVPRTYLDIIRNTTDRVVFSTLIASVLITILISIWIFTLFISVGKRLEADGYGKPLNQAIEWTNLQIWAKENTNESSEFFIEVPPYSWRGVSQRAYINPGKHINTYIYPEFTHRHNLEYERIVNQLKNLSHPVFTNEELFYIVYSQKNGGNYVVREKAKATLDNFYIKYETESFVIYEVPNEY